MTTTPPVFLQAIQLPNSVGYILASYNPSDKILTLVFARIIVESSENENLPSNGSCRDCITESSLTLCYPIDSDGSAEEIITSYRQNIHELARKVFGIKNFMILE